MTGLLSEPQWEEAMTTVDSSLIATLTLFWFG